MPTNFTAAFGHNLEADLLSGLPHMLKAEWKLVVKECNALMAYLGSAAPPETWHWTTDAERLKRDGTGRLEGPCGFRGFATSRWIELHHPTDWKQFLDDPVPMNHLTEIVRLVARELGAHFALYLPEGWHGELGAAVGEARVRQASIDELRVLLEKEWGQPAADIRALAFHTPEASAERAWFVEQLVLGGSA